MASILRILVICAGAVIGAATGGAAAIFATCYLCVFIDWIRNQHGGDGLLTLGGFFCFVTAPAGICLGGFAGLRITQLAIAEKAQFHAEPANWYRED